jgi:hypothetical protein
MPIVVALLVLIALVWGAVHLFNVLAAQFGVGVAIGAAVLAAAIVVAAFAWWWRRRQEVAANIHDGDWSHQLKENWGEVRLSAGKRLCNLTLNGAQGAYIFADLRAAQAAHDGHAWRVALEVKDSARPVWQLPMRDERQARQWQRIFTLAIAQKL